MSHFPPERENLCWKRNLRQIRNVEAKKIFMLGKWTGALRWRRFWALLSQHRWKVSGQFHAPVAILPKKELPVPTTETPRIYEIVTLRVERHKVQFCACQNAVYTYIHKVNYVSVYKAVRLTSKHRNLIGRTMTAPPPMLSPSSILLPISSHCNSIHPMEKLGARWKKKCHSNFSLFFKKIFSINLRKLNSRKESFFILTFWISWRGGRFFIISKYANLEKGWRTWTASRTDGNFEQQNKDWESSIITINYCIFIIKTYCNYVINPEC
jgi:hypothetical protein